MKSPVCFRLLALLFLSCFFCPRVGGAQEMDSVAIKTVDSLIQVSRGLTDKRDFEKALEVNAAAEQLALEKFGKESAAYGSCCFNRGRILYHKPIYYEAEKWLLTAEDIQRKTVGFDNIDYANTLNMLAQLYHEDGYYEKSEYFNFKSKNIREKILGKESPIYAESLSNIASLYKSMGQFEKAELYNNEAKDIRSKILGKEHPDYAVTLNNMANLYRSMGEYEKAERFHIEARAIRAKKLGVEHPYYATTLNNLANLYYQLGIFKESEILHLEAKSIRERKYGKEHPSYAASLNNLASVYLKTKEFDKAEVLFIEAREIRGKIFGRSHRNYATSLENLALVYTSKGKFDEAESLYLEAKSIYESAIGKEHPDYALSLMNLADFYHHLHSYEKAEALYLNSLEIFNKAFGEINTDYVATLRKISKLFLVINNYTKAKKYLIKSSIIEKILLSKSVRHLSQRELNEFGENFIINEKILNSFAQQHSGENVIVQCYDNSLFYKGFLLSASNQISRLAQTDSTTTEKFNTLKSYHRRLSAQYALPITERKGVEELEAKADSLEKVLVRTVAGFGEVLRQVTWQEVQSALKPGEAAIEFVHFNYWNKKETDSTLYAALVLRPGDAQPQYVPLCEARQLAKAMDKGKESYAKLYSYEKGEASLYELLWKPLAPLLEGVKTVYCSPSGELHRLNLGAIAMPKGGVLANRHQLRTLLSTRQLAQPSAAPSKAGQASAAIFGGVYYDADSTAILNSNRGLGLPLSGGSRGYLAYADSSFYTGSFGYLPHTKEEANAIRQKLQSSGFQTSLFLGAEATEEALKRLGSNAGASPTVLHIATHGYFSPDPAPRKASSSFGSDAPAFVMSEHPLIRSGLLLAGANESLRTKRPVYEGAEDGILTAHEVSLMNLSNTQLVVLSACETGLGDIQGNEGVYGLQRAFHIAGARYILMSLWKVDDEATKVLMEKFYQNWLVGKLPIEEAFRQAQLYLRQEAGYDDPKYWAGFVLIEG